MKKNLKVLVIKVSGDGWISRRYLVGEECELKKWMWKYLNKISVSDKNEVIGCSYEGGYCDVIIGNKKVSIDIVSCKVL
jgi:hypothetical protein